MAVGNIIYSTSSTTIASGNTINASDFERSTNLQVDTVSGNLNIAGGINTSGTSNLGSVDNVKISGGSNGQYLQTDGSSNLSWATLSVPSRVEFFTTSTSWTAPAGVTRVFVRALGGGGGGGKNSSGPMYGGGGGGYAESVVTVVPGTSYTITVGGGGPGAIINSTGGAGGNSSFGVAVVASGGNGGWATSGLGGGFSGTSNIFGIAGVNGRLSPFDDKSGYTNGGAGGISGYSRPGTEIFNSQVDGGFTIGFFGDGGRGNTSTLSAASATRFGAGGGSALGGLVGSSAGNGSQGFVILQY